jgi:hypothetical protein
MKNSYVASRLSSVILSTGLSFMSAECQTVAIVRLSTAFMFQHLLSDNAKISLRTTKLASKVTWQIVQLDVTAAAALRSTDVEVRDVKQPDQNLSFVTQAHQKQTSDADT